jgi:hypothetical protein
VGGTLKDWDADAGEYVSREITKVTVFNWHRSIMDFLLAEAPCADEIVMEIKHSSSDFSPSVHQIVSVDGVPFVKPEVEM